MPSATNPGALPDSQLAHFYNARAFDPTNPWSDFDPGRAALVLVDLIEWQVAPDDPSVSSIRELSPERADYIEARCAQVVLPSLARLVPAARKAGVLVVHARLASRVTDFSDIVPALRPYARAANARDGTPGCEPIAQVSADQNDLSIVKTGSGAFGGTDLDFLLRRRGINTLVYAGVVTNACVMLSVAGGFDLGYRQYLITDCTGALCDDDQADAERLIGFYMAQLVDTDEMLEALQAA